MTVASINRHPAWAEGGADYRMGCGQLDVLTAISDETCSVSRACRRSGRCGIRFCNQAC